MSLETTLHFDVIHYKAIDFCTIVFEVEKDESTNYSEKTLDPDIIIFNNQKNRFDKLKENGQVEIEKITKDISQPKIHELL
ncbi:hypothetical protein SAMN04488700_0600 [Carnobacterium iners]|uniref:Uncharacterized protein n=1 Tax=Carnobacterium iners TaxID=1073423 RepID=A0A1X7MSI2_9LACT|nr:hypothetical protein [Carnobacterium iners]SEL15225.1 hypothetical protein SAMN04488114_13028 [Carnobacterium iners]SMH27298.1 hypothetical protein SAMN04488700_0600 [Carnobacterium iners]